MKNLINLQSKRDLILAIFAILLLIYTIFGFFGVPFLIKNLVPNLLEDKASLYVENAKFNPFSFELNATNIELNTTNELFKLAGVNVDLNFKDLLKNSLSFDVIELKNPVINIEKEHNLSYNFDPLISNSAQDESPSSTNVIINALKIQNGILSYKDKSLANPFELEIDDINYQIKNINLDKKSIGNHLFVGISKDIDNLKYNAEIFINPLAIQGEIWLNGLKISPFWLSFLQNGMFDIKNGKIDAHINYNLSTEDGLKIALNRANLDIADLEISDENRSVFIPKTSLEEIQTEATFGEDIKFNANIKDINLENLDLKDHNQSLKIPKITLNSLQINEPNNLNFKNLTIKNPHFNAKNINAHIADINASNFDLSGSKSHLEKLKIKDINTSYSSDKMAISSLDINATTLNIDENSTALNLDQISLKGAKFFAKNENFAAFNSLNLDDIKFKDNGLNIDLITLNSPHFSSFLDENGLSSINSLALLKLENNDKKAGKNDASSEFKFAIKNANINSANAKISENFSAKKLTHTLDNINLSLKNINESLNHIALKIEANSVPLKLKSSGKADLNPLNFDLELNATAPTLSYFNSYLSEFLNAKIKSGSLNYAGALKFKENLALEGKLNLVDFEFMDELENRLFSVKNIAVNNAKITPQSAELTDIDINSPFTKIFIDKDKNLNFSKLIKNHASSTDAKKESEFDFSLKNIAVNNAKINIIDESLFIPFDFLISDIKTKIDKINKKNPSFIKLGGRVGSSGLGVLSLDTMPFDYKSKSTMDLIFKDVELKDATPYSAKFLGYEILGGKLNLNLKYEIKEHNLSASNAINLDNFKLGKTIDSNDSVNLPIKFAMSILEDQNGQINIDLPISGDLDSPKFSYGKIVWGAVGKLFSDIVLSPFRFIGNALGIDTKGLESVDFEFASSEILGSEISKIDNLVKIANQKPNIKLTLTPTFNEKGDTWEFKRRSFDDTITLLMNKSSLSYDDALKELKIRYSIPEDKDLKTSAIQAQKFSVSRLDDLAKDRANSLQKELEKKGVSSSQIIIKKITKIEAKQGSFVPLIIGVEN